MTRTLAPVIAALALSACGAIPDGTAPGTPPESFHKVGRGGIPVIANHDCSGGVWRDGRQITASHCHGFPRHKNEADITFGKMADVQPPVWRDPVRGERVEIWCDVGPWTRRYEGYVLNPAYEAGGAKDGRHVGVYFTAKFENMGLNYGNGCSGGAVHAMSDGAALGVATIGNTMPTAHTPGSATWNLAGIPTGRLEKLARQ